MRQRIGKYWLSRRPNSKQWCRTWFDIRTRQTKRASLGTEDAETAWQTLSEWVALNGKRDHEDARTVLVADVFARFQRQHGSQTRGAGVQARNLVLLLERLPEGVSVAELTLEQQQRVVARMQAEGYSAGTIKRAWGIGKAAINWAWKNLNPYGRVQTRKRRPIIPMANWLRPFIEAADGHLVSFHGRPVQKINKAFRAVRASAGFGADVVPYTVRHSIATEMMRRGVPELEIAAVLGHVAPIRTTGRYLHAKPNHLTAARQALDEIAEDISALAVRPMYPAEGARVRTPVAC